MHVRASLSRKLPVLVLRRRAHCGGGDEAAATERRRGAAAEVVTARASAAEVMAETAAACIRPINEGPGVISEANFRCLHPDWPGGMHRDGGVGTYGATASVWKTTNNALIPVCRTCRSGRRITCE